MFEIDSKILDLIKKTCKGKKHIKLTVGYVSGNDAVTKVFDAFGELQPPQMYNYEIGSITKTFTASLLAKYVFEKRMSLNDSIQKYVADIPSDRYFPTILRLATHTSGYSAKLPFTNREYLKLIFGLITGGEMQKSNPLNMDFNKMKMLIENHQLKDADYSWKYSNFGISLIGYAIGSVSQNGYWDTMNDFLFNELGLKNTYLGTSPGRNLHGYNAKNNDCGNWHWDQSNLISPAGAISATAEDLLAYAKLNMHNKKPYTALCHQRHGLGTKKHDMGLGWWLPKENSNVIMHGGGTGCFSSFLGIDKEKKVASVVLANYRLGKDSDEKIGRSLLESLQDKAKK